MQNIILTGSNGFVGRNLVKVLTEESYHLKLIGRHDCQEGSVPFFQADLASEVNYSLFMQDTDVVIHSAARVHVMDETSPDPVSLFREVNTLGTLNLAVQAAKNGVKRFVFISTVKVNGESTSSSKPYKSSDKRNPEDPYGISKAEAEEQLLALGKETGMEIVIIRPPLVYGEGVKANFASLMKLVSKGFPLPFRLINNNKRSLVSVYNLVDLIKVCISHPNAANQVFLVSDDNDLSTAEMVALMAKVQNKTNFAIPVPVSCFTLAGRLLGKQSVIDRLTGSLQLDITHTKETLNWQPPFSIEHGFKLAAKGIDK